MFTQEIIDEKASVQNITNCSVPVSNTYYDSWQYGDGAGDELPLIPMVSAIDTGFMYPADYSDYDSIERYVDCATGNCTFGQYTSLAVCSSCANISDSVITPCYHDGCPSSERIHLPDDSLSLDPVNGYLNITSDTVYPNASLLPDIGPLIARYKALGSANFSIAPYALNAQYIGACRHTTHPKSTPLSAKMS